MLKINFCTCIHYMCMTSWHMDYMWTTCANNDYCIIILCSSLIIHYVLLLCISVPLHTFIDGQMIKHPLWEVCRTREGTSKLKYTSMYQFALGLILKTKCLQYDNKKYIIFKRCVSFYFTIGYVSCLCSQAIRISGERMILSPELISSRPIWLAWYTKSWEGIITGGNSCY